MADCIVYSGGMFDNSALTARKEDVKAGAVFIGVESEENNTGDMPDYSDIAQQLSINGTFEIPTGHINSVTIGQDIPTLGPQYIYPTVNGLSAGVKGAYMTGNVVVAAIQGISEEVIKKGVTIGPYTGIFEGYVD